MWWPRRKKYPQQNCPFALRGFAMVSSTEGVESSPTFMTSQLWHFAFVLQMRLRHLIQAIIRPICNPLFHLAFLPSQEGGVFTNLSQDNFVLFVSCLYLSRFVLTTCIFDTRPMHHSGGWTRYQGYQQTAKFSQSAAVSNPFKLAITRQLTHWQPTFLTTLCATSN